MSGADSPLSDSESSWDGSDDQREDLLPRSHGYVHIYRNVKTILDQLARVSLAIQKSGAKHKFKKADALLDEAFYETFKSHLTFLILITLDPTSRSLSYEELSEVQKRLVRANIVRRNRIEQLTRTYPSELISRKQAEERRGTVTDANETLRDATLPFQDMRQQAKISLKPKPASQFAPETKPTHSVVADQTTTNALSTLGSGLTANIQAILFKENLSVATKATCTGTSLEYPRCPPGKAGEVFKCPYCNSFLPPQYREETKWTGHVAQDIMPYQCIFKECKTPDDMFITTDELMVHVMKEHCNRYWICQYESHSGTEDEPKIFKSPDDWHSHMETWHTNIIPVDQINSCTALSEKTMVPPMGCPLCSHESTRPTSKIDGHILQHVHEFSLRSLPWESRANEEIEFKTSAKSSVQVKMIAQANVAVVDNEGDDRDEAEGLEYLDKEEPKNIAEILAKILSLHKTIGERIEQENYSATFNQLIHLCKDEQARLSGTRTSAYQQNVYATAIRKLLDFMKHFKADIDRYQEKLDHFLPSDMINEIANNFIDEISSAWYTIISVYFLARWVFPVERDILPDVHKDRSSINEAATDNSSTKIPSVPPKLPQTHRSSTFSPLFTNAVKIHVVSHFDGHTEEESLDLPRLASTQETYSYIEKTKAIVEKYCQGRSKTAELALSNGNCVISWRIGDKRYEDPPHRLISWEDWGTIEPLVAEHEDQNYSNLLVTITRNLELMERPMIQVPDTQIRKWLLMELRRAKGTRTYIPKESLEKYTTQDIIARVLDDEPGDLSISIENSQGRKQLAGKIYRRAHNLFALFVLERMKFTLLEEIVSHSKDSMVPMPLPDPYSQSIDWLERMGDEEQKQDYQVLYERQWPVQAACFFIPGQEQNFHPNLIVPYLSKEEFDNGTFSTLYKVRIEPSHQKIYRLRVDDNPELALKIIARGRGSESAFRNEQLVLKGLQNLTHDHIIQLLGTYNQDNIYHFLFPLADCNLERYMAEPPLGFDSPESEISKIFLSWIWQQMKGISSGTCAIHGNSQENSQGDSPGKLSQRPETPTGVVSPTFLERRLGYEQRPEGTGYHHDIKPANILHFSQDRIAGIITPPFGILQIADFGIAKFHRPLSGTGTGSFRGTVTYAAPESTVPWRSSIDSSEVGNGLRASCPYDIWSFGCVLMEVLIWCVLGPKERAEFAKARNGLGEEGDYTYVNSYFSDAFFSLTRDSGEPQLRTAVSVWLGKLTDHRRIQNNKDGSLAQVLALIRKVLNVDPNTRPTAEFVTKELKNVVSTAIIEATGLSTIKEVPSNESNVLATATPRTPTPAFKIQSVEKVDAEIAEAASNSQRNSFGQRLGSTLASYLRQAASGRRLPSMRSSPIPRDKGKSKLETWKSANTYSSMRVQPSESRGSEQISPPTSP